MTTTLCCRLYLQYHQIIRTNFFSFLAVINSGGGGGGGGEAGVTGI